MGPVAGGGGGGWSFIAKVYRQLGVATTSVKLGAFLRNCLYVATVITEEGEKHRKLVGWLKAKAVEHKHFLKVHYR